jgi:LysR family transcriptional regulator for bpeEF and oprC
MLPGEVGVRGLSGLDAFVAVARLRSFGAAGRALGLTTAAVSKSIARLEEELGARLFERTSRRVALTPEGQLLLGPAQTALDAVQAGRDLVASARTVPEGQVRLSLPFVLGPVVVRALPRLLARHPRLRVALAVTDRRVQLPEDDVDVAVRIGPVADDGLVARPLRELRWVLVAAPAYLGRAGTPHHPGDLAGHARLVFVGPTGVEAPWLVADAELGAAVVQVDQGQLLVDAAVAGLGVAQVFDFLVAGELARGELVEVLPGKLPAGPAVHAVVAPNRRRSPRVRAVLTFLEEALG